MVVDIYDNNDGEFIAQNMDESGITDSLVCHFFPNGDASWRDWGNTAQEVYDTCCKCGEAWNHNEPTEAYEAYLGIAIN